VSGMEPISDDLKELIALFKSKNVEFLIVGAHALAFYGLPRATYDLDIWIRTAKENIQNVVAALRDFGIPLSVEEADQFLQPRQMLILGVPPNQVDVMSFLDGCDFGEAWGRRVEGNLAGEAVHFISLADYVRTKSASGRPKDINDLESLRQLLGSLPPLED
jgi:hypothetical protein